jgi:hypothetical protein
MKRPATLAELACFQKRKPIHEALRRSIAQPKSPGAVPAAGVVDEKASSPAAPLSVEEEFNLTGGLVL